MLRAQIGSTAVQTDRQVKSYTEVQRSQYPGEAQLAQARVGYRAQLIRNALEFSELPQATEALRRHGISSIRSYAGATEAEFDALVNSLDEKVIQVAARFGPQLQHSLREADLDSVPVPVPERCQKAAQYFKTEVDTFLNHQVKQLDLNTDNKDAGERSGELLADVYAATKLRQTLLAMVAEASFDPFEMVARKSKLMLEDEKGKGNPMGRSAGLAALPVKSSHPQLFTMLNDWRATTASLDSERVSDVLTSRCMREICEVVPETVSQLSKVQGMGVNKLKRYADGILQVVQRYRKLNSGSNKGSEGSSPVASPAGAHPADEKLNATAQLTTSMFRLGQSPDEIATERGLKASTILSHLASAIESGSITGEGILTDEDYNRAVVFLEANGGELVGAYDYFEGKLGGNVINVAKAIWSRSKAQLA